MTRKAARKKSAAKKPSAKAKPAGRRAAGKRSNVPAPRRARTPTAKRTEVFVVQRKTYGVYGDTLYTDPDRVFATEELARRHAESLNRELLALRPPFEQYDAGSLITGGDDALTALVAKLGLKPPTAPGRYGSGLDWPRWWRDNYFNLTDDQRDALCRSLDKFEWYVVRTTTLE